MQRLTPGMGAEEGLGSARKAGDGDRSPTALDDGQYWSGGWASGGETAVGAGAQSNSKTRKGTNTCTHTVGIISFICLFMYLFNCESSVKKERAHEKL